MRSKVTREMIRTTLILMMIDVQVVTVVEKSKKRRRGDRVEAKVKGWTKYYGGEITRVNDDGTYDIKFDDGERKRGVKDSEIKGNKGDDKDDSDDDDDRRSSRGSSRKTKKRRRGDRVEAKVKGWTKYYGGEITRVNDDGTYDIKFDDGERKRGVKDSEIKGNKGDDIDDSDIDDDRRSSRDSSRKTKKRRRGDRVEAKVKGWTKYYGGEITRVNDDGTYDIKFDDGERKRGVKDSEIKGNKGDDKDDSDIDDDRRSSRDSSRKTKKRRRGDRVEAKVKGWTKYYGGEITRVNDDGTYDIKFDDGERKRGVKIVRSKVTREMIRTTWILMMIDVQVVTVVEKQRNVVVVIV